MTIAQVIAELDTIVDGIAVAAGIATVYNYPPTNLGNTPAVIITDGESLDSYKDTARNKVVGEFIVRVVVDKGTADDSVQYASLISVVDSLLTELRKSTHAALNCQSHSLYPRSEQSGVATYGSNQVFYKDIIMTTESLSAIV